MQPTSIIYSRFLVIEFTVLYYIKKAPYTIESAFKGYFY